MDPAITRELSQLDPTVPFRASCDHLHHTWAKPFFARPELYIQPRTISEIQQIVVLASRCRRTLITVGSGHSPSDLTCTSSWMINLDDFNSLLEVDNNLVKVQASIRLRTLGRELERHHLTLANLGSIDSQSIAGALATGTHGSSLQHGLLSEYVESLSLVLPNGELWQFKPDIVSGCPAISWRHRGRSRDNAEGRERIQLLSIWSSGLWNSHDFIRVLWLPYERSAIIRHAEKTSRPVLRQDNQRYSYIALCFYHSYQFVLALANIFPFILPWIEWGISGMRYGFGATSKTLTGVSPAREGLMMEPSYPQLVNEWALPLENGPEAILRLSAWLHGDHQTAQIPFSSKGVWVNCAIKVRVVNTSVVTTPRPFLDPTCHDRPTLYLNATLHRPYLLDPPCRDQYYQAFEYLMRELGGRPHWAKNFGTVASSELHKLYGNDMDQWVKIQKEVDPEGLFLGEWHYRNLPVTSGVKRPKSSERLETSISYTG
ncbi:D-arabinono-1-4-lactone oxidase [Penicillium canescens]|uniref:D-arabinono-1-4-lactone oxidase n=1 Tax=Penicillium canescens TaxID=5083 RepID=UPI0026E04D62|nr:D-arabinono-1-4-lactone oxidase [Penicillium canescens]KAJ6032895.1 D-arabinono-1-4-lactone oxidase [Penicillium canescens]KAJ6059228.1 D-arabinono-1-4-lactone oxidase [Penicillium canescens]